MAKSEAPRERDLWFSACLGVLALLPRLYVAIAWSREPVWTGTTTISGRAGSPRASATRTASKRGTRGAIGPSVQWAARSRYRIFGSGPHVATVFNAVVGALLAVFTHRFARYELSKFRARLAGVMTAAYPGLITYSALVMTEPLSALAGVIAGWAWVRHRARRPIVGAALFGLLIGLGTLVHPSFNRLRARARPPRRRHRHELASLARASFVDRRRGGRDRLCIRAGLTLDDPKLSVMDRLHARFLPMADGTSRLEAFSRATGRFETLRSSDGCAVVTGQVQQDACWRDSRSLRSAAIRRAGSASSRRSSASPSITSRFPSSTCTRQIHRWPEERRRTAEPFSRARTGLCSPRLRSRSSPSQNRTDEKEPRPIGRPGDPRRRLSLFAWLGDDAHFFSSP